VQLAARATYVETKSDVTGQNCPRLVIARGWPDPGAAWGMLRSANWPRLSQLGFHVGKHADDVAGASVLELGSGTGACGLYAAALGASRVVLTDGREGLLPLQDDRGPNTYPEALALTPTSTPTPIPLQDDNIRRNAPLMRAGTRVTSETPTLTLTPSLTLTLTLTLTLITLTLTLTPTLTLTRSRARRQP
jgi:hypothetical protein